MTLWPQRVSERVLDHCLMYLAIYWRHAFDGRRNAINMVGGQYFSHRELHGLALADLIESLKDKYNVDPYRDYPSSAIHGTFLKRKLHPHIGFNPKTGQSVPSMRARIEARSFAWQMPELARAEMALSKYWELHHPESLESLDLD